MDKIFTMALIAASFAACKSTKTESAANKALLRRFYEEVYVRWNMAMVDEVLSSNFISHDWLEGTEVCNCLAIATNGCWIPA